MKKSAEKKRCAWVKDDDHIYIDYHDKEWGVTLLYYNHLAKKLSLNLSPYKEII